MARAITGIEAIEIIKQSMVGSGSGVTEDEIDTPGTDLNLFAAAVGAVAEAVSAQIVKVRQAMSIMTASDDELDALSLSLHGLERQGDAPSFGTMTFERPNDDFGAFTYPKGSRISVPNGTEVETLEDADFGATDLTVSVAAKSVLAGLQYNIDETGVVTKIISKPLDRTMTATNSTKFVGGCNRWSGDRYKQEIVKDARNRARGTLASIEIGAVKVDGVSYAKAENNLEFVDGTYIPDGQVNLHISDPNGLSNQDIADEVSESLDEYAPAGVYVKVNFGDREWLDIEVEVEFDNTNVSTTTKKALIKRAIAAYVNQLGNYVPFVPYHCAAAILSVNGVRLTSGAFIEPSGVTYPSATNKTFRTSVQRIKVNGS